eukprot:CAMPEP_0168730682 /NCGR_PEP_ID=MMETSP0724-20121128/6858_1 /TAXON_ID=265536 /ORGANISM="Amphiprora sp., Strain CCMP467" /LENGTH=470 /DNA_ID=CAMNT_0008777631 /DNA_START=78 /DNA_END=1490 /DNA_ORIENTATION=+
MSLIPLALLSLAGFVQNSHGFVQLATTSSPPLTTTKLLPSSPLWAANDAEGANDNESSGLLLQKDAKSQLFASFSALSLADQYDAVLTGLCAKILDGTLEAKSDDEERGSQLSDPMQLLQEMNDKRLVASPRSIMALIDATVKAQDAKTLASVMSLCTRNGAVTSFGYCLQDIQALPATPQTSVRCPDGSTKTRTERLQSTESVPVDDRVSEVGSALATLAIAGSCEMTDFVPGLADVSPEAHIILTAMVTVGVVDNFYDLLKSASNVALSQVGGDDDKKSNLELPEKEALPFGLGSGQATGQVVRGMTRLFSIDPTREAQTEAAALFVAYSLALPVFCFRSNSLEAALLAAESTEGGFLSDTGILRLLMWLLAPVAAEAAQYPTLISSDPREATGFLDRLESYAEKNPTVAEALWWMGNDQERTDLLNWAYAETSVLLRDNRKVVRELTERLEGGAATIGDCIAVMERW